MVLQSAHASAVGYTWSNAFPGITFTNPVTIVSAPGETNRLFVVEKKGVVVVITNLAAPTRSIFMNITSRVTSLPDTMFWGEEGCLGLAFHPGYATNGYFYMFYTGNATTAAGTGRHDILSRFQVSPGNSNQGDPNSEVRYIVQWDEAANHNGGDMHFGPDGYLYVALADEGGSYCQYNNCQVIDTDFYSAIMRIDVDNRPGNLPPNGHPHALPSLSNYSVPADNPWVGAASFNGNAVNPADVRTEFWAVGMRNPWRFSFDPLSGRMYLGHVGQAALEWVNIVTNGANCAWDYYEGDLQLSAPPPGFTYTPPLIEYGHTNSRNCIIGGVVYYGNRMPALDGAYIYADYGSGEIWALRHTGPTVTQNTRLFQDSNERPVSFGIDPFNNDVLYAAVRNGNNSMIKRIVMTNSIPVFTNATLNGGTVVFSGASGTPNTSYHVLQSPGLTSSFASWTPVLTNSFDANGNFSFSRPWSPSGQVFHVIVLP